MLFRSVKHAAYLTAIGSGNYSVSLPLIIMDYMRTTALSKKANGALPYGSLVTRLIMSETRLGNRTTDVRIAKQVRISVGSISKSVSALSSAKRARQDSGQGAGEDVGEEEMDQPEYDGGAGGFDMSGMYQRLDSLHGDIEAANQRLDTHIVDFSEFRSSYGEDRSRELERQRYMFQMQFPGVDMPPCFFDPYSGSGPGSFSGGQ